MSARVVTGSEGVLPGSLEWWHVVLSIAAIIFTLSVQAFGRAFSRWADKLDTFTNAVNMRLDKMENEVTNRIKHLENKFDSNEQQTHALTVQWERRITWVEAQMTKFIDRSSRGP